MSLTSCNAQDGPPLPQHTITWPEMSISAIVEKSSYRRTLLSNNSPKILTLILKKTFLFCPEKINRMKALWGSQQLCESLNVKTQARILHFIIQ